MTDTVPGIEPQFSLTYKRHYVQNINNYRHHNKQKRNRKQFRNKISKLHEGSLLFVCDPTIQPITQNSWQAAIVIRKCPLHLYVYGQVNQKYFTLNVGSNSYFLTDSEYDKKFGLNSDSLSAAQ